MFHSVSIEPSVLRSIRPDFLSKSILLIFLPVSLVVCTIDLCQPSLPMNFIISPFTYVDEPILGIDEVPSVFSLSVSEVAFVLAAIRPYLLSFAI